MNELGLENLLDFDSSQSPGVVLVGLAIGFLLSLLLRWHYLRFGSPLSDRRSFSGIFPYLVLTVTLIIAVVKSSLALSLGLVGALSIVRFRTPIKEPEELAYIFLAIAMGLGLGADQRTVTVLSSIVILFLMALFKMSHKKASQNLFLSFSTGPGDGDPAVRVDELSTLVASRVDGCELRRVDMDGGTLQAVFFVETPNVKRVYDLLEDLRAKHPAASISLIDQHRVPGV